MHSLTLSEVFESQVKKFPERIAIKYEKNQFNYRELNARANQLAHLLIKKGIKTQSLVAIQLKRSPELVIAILAVFKIGSAYVPLDPIYPQKRIEFILEDIKPSYVISTETFLDPLLLEMLDFNPGIKYSPTNLANIMYTSGSTGFPKGVMITHHNIYRLFKQTNQIFHFNENDIWSLFHSFSFDVSVWEMWGAFFYGGQLVITPEEIARSIEDFYELISREKITILCQTPSVFNYFIQHEFELEHQHPLNLRYVILAGEALNPTMLKPWFDRHGDSIAIVNMYGITETTIHSTFHFIKNASDPRSMIGRPIPDLEIYLFDQNMQPVPPGNPGEIYLSGGGLARGYWNRPELTKERFLDQPIRLYKSGDIAIYHQEENVYEYLCRSDDQIKIRGYRIEIYEIEYHIRQYECIKDVRVIARETSSQEKQLIAYLIHSEREFSNKSKSSHLINSLREYLRLHLPDFMIPAHFAFVKGFPLTHNGKLDKRKLVDTLQDSMFKSTETIHGLFECQVEKTPHATALLYKDEVLTFEEFNSKANQVSHYLLSISEGKKVPIGLSMERTPNALIAILGIFKAGCIYVPIHPKRLEFVSNEIEAPLIFTDATFHALWPKIASQPKNNLNLDIDPHSLAYIIYTSGSTGNPKGVMGHHNGLLNRFHWMWQRWPFENHEQCCQKTSFYFVDSFWEIFGPLLKGVPLVIVPEAIIQNLEDFISFLARNVIKRIVLVPSLLKAMLEHEQMNQLTQLHIWTASGEILPVDVVEKFQKVLPHAFLLNIYGSSEVAADVTCFEAHLWKGETKSIPIGQPIPNIKIHILNENFLFVKNEEIGEIFVEGAGVALGYYKQPELSNQSFVSISSKRLYKTGDFGRWLPDGNIEYLGRHDRQIKIRGVRIEISEIENVLSKHSGVKDCIVISNDQQGLKAFIVLRKTVEREELYSHLAKSLPEYMHPNEFVFLEQLPLNPNGKIDHVALKNTSSSATTPFMTPQNEIEKIIAFVWSELLGIPEIGQNHHFFYLGGHSLLATRLISRLKRLLHKNIPIRLIFDYPTLSEFSAHVEKLQSTPFSQVAKQTENQNIPLSFNQHGLWFTEKYIAQKEVYTVFRSYSLNGYLNLNSLQESLNQIINRHEMLRTSFYEHNQTVYQCIHHKVELKLQINHDLDVENFIKEDFDLSKAPLFRIKLVRITSQHHILLLAMHHMITDGWSVNIFLRELNALYNTQSQPKPLTFQYSDYVIWQQKQLVHLEDQAHYWKQQLKNISQYTYLPYDYLPHPCQSYLVDNHFFIISQSEVSILKKIGEHSQATLFMVLLAAFQVLLYRYSGYEDIVIGSVIANRNQEEFEETIGQFASIIMLRNHCQGSLSFQDFLEQVRDVAIQAYHHQDYPFDKLFEAIPECRNTDHQPFFKIMFVHNVMACPLALDGLACQELKIKRIYSPFDLTLLINEMPEGIEISFEYASDKFKLQTIERMAKHFHVLLQSIMKNSYEKISLLALLPEEERKQLHSFGHCEYQLTKERTIVELFSEQVKKSPEAIALIDENQQISYQELDQASDQIAKQLTVIGITPDSVVAVSQERSIILVIYLLGILKSGAAYLFLDPSWPQKRKDLILADVQPAAIITHSLECKLSLDNDILLFPKPHQLAYVIYTSGSSGNPKGVMIEHRSICDRLIWCKDHFDLSKGSRFLHMHPFSFDASVLLLWWPLIAGGCVVIASSVGMRDPEYLKDLINRERINLLGGTPSQLEFIFEGDDSFNSLHTVFSGGEILNKKLLQHLLKKVPKVINFYGPTESAVIATYWEAQLNENKDIIGSPCGNTQIFILDENKKEVPIGVKGEIYIAGLGVARGYWNNPEMNSMHFFEHPVKMYKTGDMGRFLENGNIEFLGRLDRQVKVHGFRIELNEIEACLRSHPSIKEAYVNFNDQQFLDAYVILEQLQNTLPDIRQYLSHHLPSYMIPQNIHISKKNLNDHGKLNKQSLPIEMAMPKTSIEKQLAIIWKKLLHLSTIDTHCNIFHLGATSLLCVKASLLAKQLGLIINVRQFFEHQTIVSLAIALSNDSSHSVIPIQEHGNRTPLFLIHPGLGLVFPYRILSKYLSDLPIYAIENPRFAGIHSPYSSLKDMAKDYVDLILQAQPKGPYRIGGWSFGGNVALEIAQQLKNLNHFVEQVLMIDSYHLSENENNMIEHSAELLHLFEEEIVNNINLAKAYKPLPYVGKITLLQAEESKFTRANGWDCSLFPSMEIIHIAGNHSRLFEEPLVKEIVRILLE